MAGGGVFRQDQVRFAFAEEAVDGTAPVTIDTSMGIIKSGITLPDVTYEWDYFFGVGREGRGRRDAHLGIQNFIGSIPQIYVLHDGSREILEMVLGEQSRDHEPLAGTNPGLVTAVTATTMSDAGEDFTNLGGVDAKAGNHAVFSGISVGYIDTTAGAGVTQVTVFPTPDRGSAGGDGGWNGPQPAIGDDYEIRQTESVGVASGNKIAVGLQRLNTMSWAVRHRNSFRHGSTSVGSNLTVNYLGGKVNRATLSATQGDKLSLALDEVMFRDLRHDASLPTSGVDKFSGSVVVPSATHPTEQPLVFSQGTINLFELGNSFARIRSFTLTIENNLTAERYISTVTIAGATSISQIPFELIEGNRVITLECEAVLETREYWEHLMRQGQNDALSSKIGFDVRLQFRVDGAGAESFFIQGPASLNPVQTLSTNGAADDMFSTTAQSAADNVGAVMVSAPHEVPAEGEPLIQVTLTMDIPHLVFWWDDA